MKLVENLMKSLVNARKKTGYSQKEVSFYMNMTLREYQLFEKLKYPVSKFGFNAICEKVNFMPPKRHVDELMAYYESQKGKERRVEHVDKSKHFVNPHFKVVIGLNNEHVELESNAIKELDINYPKMQIKVKTIYSRDTVTISGCHVSYLEMIELWAEASKVKAVIQRHLR